MNTQARRGFWREAIALDGSVTPQVVPQVVFFGVLSGLICLAAWLAGKYDVDISLAVTPFELAGGVLGLLLILRTNAGYDRWWEARKLWGGIVNQSRNLTINALSYGRNRSHLVLRLSGIALALGN